MTPWTVKAGDSVLVVEITAEGHLNVDVTNGPFVTADRDAVERIRTIFGAALTVMPGTRP